MKNTSAFLFVVFLLLTSSLKAQIITREIESIKNRRYISGIGWDEWSEKIELNSYSKYSKFKVAPDLGGIYINASFADGQMVYTLLNPKLDKYNEEGFFEYTGKAKISFLDNPTDECTYKLWISESYSKLYNGVVNEVYIWLLDCNKHASSGWKFNLAN